MTLSFLAVWLGGVWHAMKSVRGDVRLTRTNKTDWELGWRFSWRCWLGNPTLRWQFTWEVSKITWKKQHRMRKGSRQFLGLGWGEVWDPAVLRKEWEGRVKEITRSGGTCQRLSDLCLHDNMDVTDNRFPFMRECSSLLVRACSN